MKKSDKVIPNSRSVYLWLYKHKKSISKVNLEKIFGINNNIKRISFYCLLKSMERNAIIVLTKDGYCTLPEFCNYFSGFIIGHRDGYGFLRSTSFSKQDIWISVENMKLCIHGDFVLASNNFVTSKNKIETHIIKVLKPNLMEIIGFCVFKKQKVFVFPYDSRFTFTILIIRGFKNVLHGSIVSVQLLRRPVHHVQALGKVTEILGNVMNINLAINIAIRTHSISNSWNKGIDKELSYIRTKISDQCIKDRIDLRCLPFITIDDEGASDFDDAIFCHKVNYMTWNLKIAISDVSYYVPPGSALDKEAQKRGNSIYFPSLTVPMLPKKLSNNVCSLLPDVDRLVLVCDIHLSLEGVIISYSHYEAVICSHNRFTYYEVYNIWKGDVDLIDQYKHMNVILDNLKKLYECLYFSKCFNKSIAFKIDEPKFILGINGTIKKIYKSSANAAHQLVEFCMILANSASAMFLEKFKEPALFRDHDPPTINSVLKLKLILKELNINWLHSDIPTAVDYNNLLKNISNRSDYAVIQILLLRSMKPAVYDCNNRGHFGLSLLSYTHFTSPIRRYTDLVLHRSIKYLLKRHVNHFSKLNSLVGNHHYRKYEIKKLAKICSINEKRSDEAVRDVVDWLKCDFMNTKINSIFYGMVINITHSGCFIRLNNILIDVFLNVSKLNNDKYIFNSKKHILVGQHTGFKFRLGDLLKVCIKSVNMLDSKIEVVLAP
ncbi:MAG: ribonuclease R [Buchnera aphidicola (Eriosoma harunire)]